MSSSDQGENSIKSKKNTKQTYKTQDTDLLFETQTHNYYHDPSSGIAKSGNILTNIYDFMVAQKELDLLDVMLSSDLEHVLAKHEINSRGGAPYLFKYRVDVITNILKGTNATTGKLRYELWSWMATNTRALWWVTHMHNAEGSDADSNNTAMPYNYIPSTRCILNCGMNFDISALVHTMDFFGNANSINRTNACKKKRTGIGKRECMERLLFLLNKSLPNRCVVRDFLSVLKSTCEESDFVYEAIWRIVFVGLIGGYETSSVRADFNTLMIVIQLMQNRANWLSWITGIEGCKPQCDRQCFLIWLIREYLYNCILDIPSLKVSIHNTNAFCALGRSVSVMDTCRQCIIDNLKSGNTSDIFNNLTLQDHLEVVVSDKSKENQMLQCGQKYNQLQSELSLDIWKLQVLTNTLESYPFEDILTNDMIRNVVSYTIASKTMDVHHRRMADNPIMCHGIQNLISMCKDFIRGMKESSCTEIKRCVTAMDLEDAQIEKIASCLLNTMKVRKSNVKSSLKEYVQICSNHQSLFNLVVFICCKQLLCSLNVHVHRCKNEYDKNSTKACVQFCPWCNRWQCLYSNVPYKKASPLLGRFVIDTENRLHCSGSDSSKNVLPSKAQTVDSATAEFEETEINQETTTGVGESKTESSKFRLCKYVAAYRINMHNIAIVSNRWMVKTCMRCHRPYVREFTTPHWPRLTCKQCCETIHCKLQSKCEICMKMYRRKSNDDAVEPFMYDNYHRHHCFRTINACVSCAARYANKRKYLHFTMANSVAMAVRGVYPSST